MNKTVFFAFAAALVLCTSSVSALLSCNTQESIFCEAGNNTTVSRDVPAFNKVKISNSFSARIIHGDTQKVTLTAGELIVDKVKTEVSDGELNIYVNGKLNLNKLFGDTGKKIEIEIEVPELVSLHANGACDVDVRGFENEDMNVIASGASNITMDEISVSSIMLLEADGASDIIISGNANKAKMKASGASNIKAKQLSTIEAEIYASGASDIKISASKSLRVNCSGASNVNYYGRPKDVDIQSSGSSDVSGY